MGKTIKGSSEVFNAQTNGPDTLTASHVVHQQPNAAAFQRENSSFRPNVECSAASPPITSRESGNRARFARNSGENGEVPHTPSGQSGNAPKRISEGVMAHPEAENSTISGRPQKLKATDLPASTNNLLKLATKKAPSWEKAREIFLSADITNGIVTQQRRALLEHFESLASRSVTPNQHILVMKDFDTAGINLVEIAALFMALRKNAPELKQINCIAFKGGQHDAIDPSRHSQVFKLRDSKIRIHFSRPAVAPASAASESKKHKDLDQLWIKLAKIYSDPDDTDPSVVLLKNSLSLLERIANPACQVTPPNLTLNEFKSALSAGALPNPSTPPGSRVNAPNLGPIPGSPDTFKSSSSAQMPSQGSIPDSVLAAPMSNNRPAVNLSVSFL
jgi:hypothetical protein